MSGSPPKGQCFYTYLIDDVDRRIGRIHVEEIRMKSGLAIVVCAAKTHFCIHSGVQMKDIVFMPKSPSSSPCSGFERHLRRIEEMLDDCVVNTN